VVIVNTLEDRDASLPRPVYCLSIVHYGPPPKHIALILRECNFSTFLDDFMRK
jgi:hypothetical protein